MNNLELHQKIPPKLQSRIYYKSAKTCAVCREKHKPVQIHHIDQNRNNNSEENLILLCNNCHDEAHTKHRLSQNLTPEKLIYCKNEWENQVKIKSVEAMTFSSEFSPLNWTYFNLSLLPNYIYNSGVDFKNEKYKYLLESNIINEELEVVNNTIKPRRKGCLMNTIYDNIEANDALILKSFYQDLVNQMIARIVPYELDAIWTRKQIRNLLFPNSYIYLMAGMYFKKICEINNVETKKIYMHAKGIKIEGYVYSNYMFGNSSQMNTYARHSFVTGLYLIKNISNSLPLLKIDVTPITLGTGTYEYCTKTLQTLRNKIL
jgi:hypothetical protein